MPDLAVLHALSAADAAEEFRRCCGSTRWARALAAGRPYANVDALHAAAEQVWWGLARADWLEAFAAHPRIGGRPDAAHAAARTADWLRAEQSAAEAAAPSTLDDLAVANAAYEARFGHIFLICATGKSAGEMLAALRARIANAPDVELQLAAAEQAKITALRIETLLRS